MLLACLGMEMATRPVLYVEAVQKLTSGVEKNILENELAYFLRLKSKIDVICGQAKISRESLVSLLSEGPSRP